MHDDHGGDEQANTDDMVDSSTPTGDDADTDGQIEQVQPDPPAESSLRRSTRDRQSSRKYPSSEYVLLTNGGEPGCYGEAMTGEHK